MKETEETSSNIQQTYDKLSHPHCGTDKCCGKCTTASISMATLVKTEEDQLNEEFESHCMRFFKGIQG